MQGVLLSDPLSDGTYHISFESDKVWVGERKNTINDAVVYDYDRYTARHGDPKRQKHRKCSYFMVPSHTKTFFLLLDGTFPFRYNKNDSKTHSISR